MTRDPSDLEDIQKIQEFLAGDTTAFEFLFDKYRDKVYSVAFRFLKHQEDALEITQEVFIRAYQGLGKFKTDSKFFTWLYRIAVNRAIDHIRSRKARPSVEMPQSEEGSLADRVANPRSVDPSIALERKEVAGKLFEAVSRLSEKHRAVFLLHAVEQLSYKEIAEVVDCSIGTVMSRLFYSRKKLQQYLAEAGAFRSSL